MNLPTSLRQELFRSTLSDDEITDPFLVIKSFFDSGSLQDNRDQFNTLLEVVYTESFGELESGDKWLLTTHLKGMERLIDASYLIHKSRDKERRLFHMQDVEITAVRADTTKTIFQKIVDLIRIISDAGKIYTIKSSEDSANPHNSRYDFLVLLDHPQFGFLEMEKKIEQACQEFGSVVPTFHRIGDLRNEPEVGLILHYTTCTKENLVFERNDQKLSFPDKSICLAIAAKARKRFGLEMKKALGFLSGAQFCISHTLDMNLGTYLLHQATELSCRAILASYLDYQIHGHNLHLLLRHIHRISEDLTNILSKGTPAENELLNLLNQSYSSARYTNSFSITTKQTNELLKRVTAFMNTVDQTFEQKMKEFEAKFNR
ncbi:HEPN domain-containing protein [Pseudobacter ginsenosidimutans]|uniref:HEPN domain-containing protein n=1 Tax=Pseudobacter ginsenosidimutans TaxID=661488 RepID=A0A4Q7N5N5_9BACT|nr:HEPN domain-containing protein [Pseudobacter ginsenosidimutans]QEC44820.1 HEPN domain-containing protein [Pseudobacter ginsenosidimutans]RZS76310.1 HEPN domain-containing protein [Pseudobacter ginsenosidimutans]